MDKNFSVMRYAGSHCVFQADSENTVYGTAPAGETVTLTISDKTEEIGFHSTADISGCWAVTLPSFKPSFTKYAFEYSCGGEVLKYDDIVFGELFHISGQSNMELPVSRTISPFEEQEFFYNDYIREFRAPIECCFDKNTEYDDFRGGEWKAADKSNLPAMSAAGYWFAVEIFQKYNIPVGLLNTSAGGSLVQGRMPYSMLAELNDHDDYLEMLTAPGFLEDTAEKDRLNNIERNKEIESLDKISSVIFDKDNGISFTKCTVPFYFRETEELRDFSGKIWFRKEFEIPAETDLTSAKLILGAMIDADRVFLNGKYVGETGYMYPPRNYNVPDGAAVCGKNTLYVCLDVRNGLGGFVKGKRYCLKLGETIIDLSGEWEYAIAAKIAPVTPDMFFQGQPLAVYAKLTAPAFRINCRALLWYQGESNDRSPENYSLLFGKFVEMYRRRCGKDIPIIFTQLCNFDDPTGCVPHDSWAVIRSEQLKCLEIPGTDMAVTIDVGESNDLHPLNKKAVGHRLALCARRLLYNDKSVPAGNYCRKASLYGDNGIILGFDDNYALVLNGNDGFEICLDGGNIIPADSAEVTSEGILLRCASVRNAVKVRCEWSNDPHPVLYGKDGLPLSPFEIKISG